MGYQNKQQPLIRDKLFLTRLKLVLNITWVCFVSQGHAESHIQSQVERSGIHIMLTIATKQYKIITNNIISVS